MGSHHSQFHVHTRTEAQQRSKRTWQNLKKTQRKRQPRHLDHVFKLKRHLQHQRPTIVARASKQLDHCIDPWKAGHSPMVHVRGVIAGDGREQHHVVADLLAQQLRCFGDLGETRVQVALRLFVEQGLDAILYVLNLAFSVASEATLLLCLCGTIVVSIQYARALQWLEHHPTRRRVHGRILCDWRVAGDPMAPVPQTVRCGALHVGCMPAVLLSTLIMMYSRESCGSAQERCNRPARAM